MVSLDGRHDRRSIKESINDIVSLFLKLSKWKCFNVALIARQFQTRVGRVCTYVLPASHRASYGPDAESCPELLYSLVLYHRVTSLSWERRR